MSSITKISSVAMAATAAALLLGGMVSLNSAPAHADGVKCSGINSCKGTSSCKSATNSCKGLNSCKGQGWLEQSSADDCTKAGGKVIE